MPAPVHALRPYPVGLPEFAVLTHTAFAARIHADPEFRAFTQAQDEKIKRLFESVVGAVQFLKRPEHRDIAKKIFNGPIELMIIKPSEETFVQVCENDNSLQARQPASDEEVEVSVRDWTIKVIAFTQLYILTSDLASVRGMLEAGDGITASFLALPPGGSTKVGFFHRIP